MLRVQINAIIAEAERAYNLKISEAEDIADEWGVSFYVGEYGTNGRTYVPNNEGYRIANQWEASHVEGETGRPYGWYSSSSTC